MINCISVLGSTGSVGTQTLEVAAELKIKIEALTANCNIKKLAEQTRKFKPKTICIANPELYSELKNSLKDCSVKILTGTDGILKIASSNSADIVCNSIVGIAGLAPTIKALENGKTVALANKESVVTGGALIQKLINSNNGCKIVPVDSEHSAIFQCLQNNSSKSVRKIFLTASGGPFLGKTTKWLKKNATIENSLKHPNWKMGKKISIDSATLMNKGFELIEAAWLFNLKPEQIEIVVHPQSVLHSAVEFVDGTVLGQFGEPTMKLPIQFALTNPKHIVSSIEPFSFFKHSSLSFLKPDFETFKCLKHCETAILKGALFPTALNAANEKAVELFLANEIGFLDIEKIINYVVNTKNNENLKTNNLSLELILKTDEQIKEIVATKYREICSR